MRIKNAPKLTYPEYPMASNNHTRPVVGRESGNLGNLDSGILRTGALLRSRGQVRINGETGLSSRSKPIAGYVRMFGNSNFEIKWE